MLIDLRTIGEGEIGHSDVCVIGAGAAGVTLARQLAAKGHSVCLLESGGTDFEQATQDLYRGANVGMPYYDLDEARLRFFGGTVSIWGGRAALLDPIDFETRSWVPHSGWPIGRAELDPYYRLAHQSLQLGDFNYEHDIWRTLGVAAPDFDPDRLATNLWRFDEANERFAASRARDLIDAPNVRIVLHANAVSLNADAEGRTIKSVQVRSLDGPVRAVTAAHFVTACGAIENARLMLASNDVEPAGVGNRHDLVGRFFMEHPCGRIGEVKTAKPYDLWAVYQKRFMRSGPPLAPVMRLGDAVQREEQALNSIVTFKLQRDPDRGVALGNKLYHNIKHSLAPNRTGRTLDHLYRGLRGWFHDRLRGGIERFRARTGMTGLYLIVRGEQAPNPDSRIILSSERDALGSRRADLAWNLSEADKHTARVLARTIGTEMQRLGLGDVEPSAWLGEAGPQWPVDPTVGNHPIAGYHQMGGTRMSSDPRAGVVDADCRVHGYDNLYIAGSSVFPTSGWANPTLTILALALRMAEHLDGRLKR